MVYSPFTVSYSGFVNGETASVLGGSLSFNGTATTAVNVGTGYVITPGGLTSSNYAITFVDGVLDITKASTTTVIASSGNPSEWGQSVTFTATVSINAPGAGTATGTVDFFEGSTLLGSTSVSSGTATFSISTLTIGSHSVHAVYSGDGNFNTSTSSDLNQVVNKSSTTTVVTSSVNPSEWGQSVTFTGAVSVGGPGAGTITGTVSFYDSSTLLGTSSINSGVATFSTSDLTVGSHLVKAVYNGDDNFTTSTSSTLIQLVNKASTNTVIQSSVNPSIWGQSVTFTGTVSIAGSGAGTFTGTVSFYESGALLGNGTVTGGVATYGTSSLSVGSHTINAVYSGDANFSASTSSSITQIVNQAQSTITVTGSTSFTYNGSPQGPNTSIVTGSTGAVSYTYSGTGSTVYNASTTQPTNAGTYQVIANVAADINYMAATSSPYAFTINKALLSITAFDRNKTYGDAVTFAGTEFATIGLLNSDAVTSVTLTSAGAAATAIIAGSPYPIVASAAVGTGLDNYTISYVDGSLTITAKALTITASDRTKAYGDAVTFAGTEFTTSGLVNSDAVTSVTLTSAGASATAIVSGSPYPIVATAAVGTGLNNYTISYVDGKLTVNAKPLTITANNLTKTYGNAITFIGTEFTTSGLLAGDAVTSVTLTSAGTAATATVSGSPYPIVPSGATGTGLNNYSITYGNGNLTVNPRALTITANDRTKTYGDAITFAGTEFTTSGLVNSDLVTSVTLTSAGAAATATVAGSTYPILISAAVGTGIGNYAISYVNGTLTVNTKALLITANNRTKAYGDAVTFLGTEFTSNGLVNSDAVASVTLTSAGALSTASIAGSPYPIVPSAAIGTGLDNYAITYANGSLTITTKVLTITALSRTKTYGDVVTFAGTEFTTSGLTNGDIVNSVTLMSTGAPATATVTGSPYTIVPSAAVGTGLSNYTINYVNGSLTVTVKELTITASDRTKVYGDAVTFAGTEFTSTGLINGDIISGVTLTSGGAVVTATVGNYPIVPSAATGTGLGNYAISYANGTLTVNAKPLVITASNRTKVYGDAVTFAGTEFTTTGLVNGDAVTSVTLTSAGAAATATVAGSPYAIVPSAAIGTGLINYNISYANGSLTVNTKTLIITASDRTKAYGDVVTFAGTEFTATGLVNGNTITSVTLTSTGSAATASTGTYPIVASAALGTGLDNYSVSYVNGTLTVTKKILSITASDRTKTYGDVVTFAGTEFTATGLINGDVVTGVTLTSTGSAATATVTGSPYPIVATAAIGTGLTNYTVTYTNGSLTVVPKAVTIGGSFTVNNKEYDGTTSATIATNNLTLVTILNGDIVNLTASAVFADKSAGTAKTVTLTGVSISGTGASNYTLSLTGMPTATADITAKELTIGGTFTAGNKVYDGTTTAVITANNLTLHTKIGADDVSLSAVAAFTDRNVGTGKSVTLTGSSLNGSDAANYALSFTGAPEAIADITAMGLTVGGSFTVNNKIYDATTLATIATNNLTLVTPAAGDDVSLNAVAVFNDKVVNTGKTVTLTGSTLTGANAGNYTLSLTGAPVATADITTRELTVGGSFTANNKVYDGTASATIATNNLTLITVAGTDVVTLDAKAVFSDPIVGFNKTVSLTGSSISGSDASNYTLSLTGAPVATANITESGLTILGVSASSKTYDGTTNATISVTGLTLIGAITGDDVSLVSTNAIGNFVDKNVGTGKQVITTGFTLTGVDAYKYTLIQPTTTADITPIGVTITGATAYDKIYDGTTSALLNSENAVLVGILTGDNVTLISTGATGTFDNANIGTGKVVTASGFTLGGTDAGNYTLTQPVLTASITGNSLTITGVTASNKTYDGTTTATLDVHNASLVGVAGSDVLTLISTGVMGSFSDKNAGTGKTVIVTGFTIVGSNAANYVLTQPEITAEILPKALTITAKDEVKDYGTTFTFTGTEYYSDGLVAGDTIPALSITSDGASSSSDIGTYDILISKADNTNTTLNNYNVTWVKGILTVNKADQVITFDQIPSGLRMSQTYTLVATSTSGLPVTFTISNPNIATLDGNVLTINQDGTFTITASQGGDDNWNAAADVIQEVTTLPTFDNITKLFTPNNDGINDYWYIPDRDQYGKLQVTVYNRYGQAVYKSDDYKNDWDGTWNGNPLPSATYYYIIKSSTKGVIKGVVNIVR